MILAGLILVPVFGILSEMFGVFGVFAGLTALVAFWGGFLRMIYALVFEGNETEMLEEKIVKFYRRNFKKQKTPEQLPPANIGFTDFSNGQQGMWRETADINREN